MAGSSTTLCVIAVAHLVSEDSRYAAAVAEGMDYLLGRNALGQSYVTGYGSDYTSHQRTRQFGHDLDPAFPPPPPGAIAGGANSRPQSRLSLRFPLAGPAAAMLLPGRADIGSHQ